MRDKKLVLCAANAYEQKYYFNEIFQGIPKSIQEEIRIIAVLFTQEAGGIFSVVFDEDGSLCLETEAEEEDITYDEVSGALLLGEIRRNRQELLESLSLYYRAVILQENITDLLEEKEMIIVIDVGNTNITIGIYHRKELITTFRMTTKLQRTSDEFGIALTEFLRTKGISKKEIEGTIVTSVVPNIMHALLGSVRRYLEQEPLTIGPGIKTGIRIVTENPREIGSDRIVDAVAAFEKYGGPVLVLDFGTATTYDLVSEKGDFVAGITAPGIGISAKALWEDTARLPEIEIRKPKSILAQETISSMQAGLVYGQIGQTEYIIEQVRKESGWQNLKVVATGGLGRIIADETDSIQIFDSTLTLDGLRIIYEKNQKS